MELPHPVSLVAKLIAIKGCEVMAEPLRPMALIGNVSGTAPNASSTNREVVSFVETLFHFG